MTKAHTAERNALRCLRLAVQALHKAAEEVYVEDAIRYMREAILMEELEK